MKKLLMLITSSLVIVGGVWYYFDAFRAPSQSVLSVQEKNKALTKLLGRKPILEDSKQSVRRLRHSSSFITFTYPEGSEVQSWENKQEVDRPDVLDSFSFRTAETLPLAVIVQVIRQKDAVLAEASGVALSEGNPAYTKTDVVIDSLPGIAFAATLDKSEKVAFFLHHDKLFTFSVRGSSLDKVRGFLDELLATVALPE